MIVERLPRCPEGARATRTPHAGLRREGGLYQDHHLRRAGHPRFGDLHDRDWWRTDRLVNPPASGIASAPCPAFGNHRISGTSGRGPVALPGRYLRLRRNLVGGRAHALFAVGIAGLSRRRQRLRVGSAMDHPLAWAPRAMDSRCQALGNPPAGFVPFTASDHAAFGSWPALAPAFVPIADVTTNRQPAKPRRSARGAPHYRALTGRFPWLACGTPRFNDKWECTPNHVPPRLWNTIVARPGRSNRVPSGWKPGAGPWRDHDRHRTIVRRQHMRRREVETKIIRLRPNIIPLTVHPRLQTGQHVAMGAEGQDVLVKQWFGGSVVDISHEPGKRFEPAMEEITDLRSGLGQSVHAIQLHYPTSPVDPSGRVAETHRSAARQFRQYRDGSAQRLADGHRSEIRTTLRRCLTSDVSLRHARRCLDTRVRRGARCYLPRRSLSRCLSLAGRGRLGQGHDVQGRHGRATRVAASASRRQCRSRRRTRSRARSRRCHRTLRSHRRISGRVAAA